MSGTVKVGDVIALPVRINEPTFIDDAGDSPLAKVRREDQAAAIARAINNHDRMRAALEHLRDRFGHYWWNKDGPAADGRLVSEVIDAALQACDAQQEPRNGTV